MQNRIITSILIALCALLYSAQVSANCSLSAEPLSFDAYDVFDTSPTLGVGHVTVTCTSATSYTLYLSPGSGSYDARELVGETTSLIYNLYVDAAYSQVWGDGSGSSAVVSGNSDSTALHDVFGRIPARQNVKPGLYDDTITVTIDF